MEEKLIEKTEESIKRILDEGIATTNLDHLYKLIDIYKDAKEVENMNYGNYGNYGGRRAGYDAMKSLTECLVNMGAIWNHVQDMVLVKKQTRVFTIW